MTCYRWIYICALADKMTKPFSPKIVYNIFDDCGKDKLDKDTKIIFPNGREDATGPITIDIIHTVRFYRHVGEKKITITLQSQPTTFNEMFQLKIEYLCRDI